jgi:CxxC-x17-CxxC domain-containing protein
MECGGEFVFSKSEQAFYAERGFTNEPKRCKTCRDKRKQTRDGAGSGGGRPMVSVTCDNCGVATEVPFTPVSGKPVYCRDCYSQRRSQPRAFA